MSINSCLSGNDKDDNKMIPGAVHRSPGIYLMDEENPGKPQLEDNMKKIVQPVIGRIAHNVRE